jgi:hypothetical protein
VHKRPDKLLLILDNQKIIDGIDEYSEQPFEKKIIKGVDIHREQQLLN